MKVNIVFEGGGIKGIAYLGVLKFLEERGIQIAKIGGTSIGAIMASLVAVGYNSQELEAIIDNFDYSVLKYFEKEKTTERILNSLKGAGIYSLQDFEAYMEKLLERKNKTKFLDLKVGEDYRLKIVVAEWTKKEKMIIPNDLKKININADTFPIAKAATMSASIPLFYRYYKINEYRFLDGGVVSNFPLDLFSKSKNPTWGFCVNLKPLDQMKLIKMFRKKIFKIDDDLEYNNYEIININTFKIKATNYRGGLAIKEQLIHSGYESTKRFFYKNILNKG